MAKFDRVFHSEIDDRGRLTIPRASRKINEILPGSIVTFEIVQVATAPGQRQSKIRSQVGEYKE